VVLDALPSGDVQINTTSGADTTSTSGVTFTTLNWNVPQTITVAALDDRIVEGAHAGSISHLVSGGGYDGVTIPDIAVSIADNDSATYRFAAASSATTETAGSVAVGVGTTFATSGTGTEALEATSDLSDGQKHDLLLQWKDQLEQLMTATSENMPGPETASGSNAECLRRVVDAMARLGR
jgi:hypothetical protein